MILLILLRGVRVTGRLLTLPVNQDYHNISISKKHRNKLSNKKKKIFQKQNTSSYWPCLISCQHKEFLLTRKTVHVGSKQRGLWEFEKCKAIISRLSLPEMWSELQENAETRRQGNFNVNHKNAESPVMHSCGSRNYINITTQAFIKQIDI